MRGEVNAAVPSKMSDLTYVTDVTDVTNAKKFSSPAAGPPTFMGLRGPQKVRPLLESPTFFCVAHLLCAHLPCSRFVMAFQLLVRASRTLTVDRLCAEDDAGTLIAAVERKAGVPCAKMWLSFAGKRLDPGTSLASYSLAAGATVHLAVRGRGGGCRASKSLERVQPEGSASSGPGTPHGQGKQAQHEAEAPGTQAQQRDDALDKYTGLASLRSFLGGGDVALVKASHLLKLASTEGGIFLRRQDLPAEAIVGPTMLERSFAELEARARRNWIALSSFVPSASSAHGTERACGRGWRAWSCATTLRPLARRTRADRCAETVSVSLPNGE